MKHCAVCREPIWDAGRRDRRYCGSTCRSRAWRARRGGVHGWGGGAARKARRVASAAVRAVAGQ